MIKNPKLSQRIQSHEATPWVIEAIRAIETSGELAQGEIDRLRAEVEALRAVLAECADDLETEVNARASGELPRRIERDLEPVRKARALLAQPAGSWVNPLAAEVEALKSALATATDHYPSVTDAIAALKGEGSEG